MPYNPSKTEDNIYKKWEKSGYFNPDNLDLPNEAQTYTIVLPPPNVTGVLHMGSAMMLVIEDIMIRYNRMRGKKTLWLPGTDHAAIATQTRVEKNLKKEGLSRHILGREKFLERVNEFVEQQKNTIKSQIRKMGSSCDWSREAFTMDETRNKAVRTVFKMMYDDGLIYRGERIVNWCPRCHSTLADDEVEYKEQKTKLWTFKYSKNFLFSISTTRPETKLGDTAVAVNPKDERYREYIGKTFDVNFCGINLKLKIIADRNVDMNFGTGALGVTPAHSMVDWDMARENELETIKVIDEDGNIKKNFGEFSGKTASEARKMIIQKLKADELIEKEEEIDNKLSLCYRCDTPIEPLPSLQWFIDVNKDIPKYKKSIKTLCLEAVRSGVFGREKINIIPDRFEKSYFTWMENLRDWCISRQIWFGHRIPVWYRNTKTQKHKNTKTLDLKIYEKDIFDSIVANKKTIETRAGRKKGEGKDWGEFKKGDIIEFYLADQDTDKIISDIKPVKRRIKSSKIFKGFDELFIKYNPKNILHGKTAQEIKSWWKQYPQLNERIEKYGIWAFELENIENEEEIYVGVKPPQREGWVQDTDTLDTWFSSGMWTFSTMANKPEQIRAENGKLKIDNEDFKNFHPTSVLETMYDILFFWVARMIIMTTYAVEDIPFQDVYMHGCVRDKLGDKMSKSKPETCIDPLDVCDKYGTDAVRLSLIIGTAPGSDTRVFDEKIAGARNLTNKIWNISRYILQNSKFKSQNEKLQFKIENLTLADKWILGKLNIIIKEINNNLDNYQFSQAGEILKDFTWNDFADWYIEISKFEEENKGMILKFILENLLKLWHPFVPFVTEKIWQEMGNDKMLMIEKWPGREAPLTRGVGGFDGEKEDNETQKHKNTKTQKQEDTKTPHEAMSSTLCGNIQAEYSRAREIEKDFNLIKNIIIAIRTARCENKIEPSKKIKAIIYAGKHKELIESQAYLIKNLKTGIEELEIKTPAPRAAGIASGDARPAEPMATHGQPPFAKGGKIENAIYTTVDGIDIYLIGAIDFEKEKERITGEIEQAKKYISQIEKKLDNKKFTNNAPQAIVNKEKDKLESQKEKLEKLEINLESLE